jgi:hypothetical protein
MEPLSMKFGSFMKGLAKFFCLASNFWHQKLVAEQKNLVFSLSWSFQTGCSRVPSEAEHKENAFGLQLLEMKVGG